MVRLHVDVDEGPLRLRGPQQHAQAVGHAARRACRVDGIELAVEGREFDRHVDSRQLDRPRAVDLWHLGPGVHQRADALDQVDVGAQIGLGLDIAGHRFAEHVERERAAQFAFALGGGQHFVERSAGDEPPGMAHGVAAGGDGQGPTGDRTRRSHGQPQPHGRGKVLPHVVKVFVQVPRDRFARGEHRQHVDEAKHLHLDALVGHGPGHDPVVPPAALEHARLRIGQVAKQVAAKLLRGAFDVSQFARVEIVGHGAWRGKRAVSEGQRLARQLYAPGQAAAKYARCGTEKNHASRRIQFAGPPG